MAHATVRPGDVIETYAFGDESKTCLAHLITQGPGSGFPYEVKVYMQDFQPQYEFQRIKNDGRNFGEIGSTYTATRSGAWRFAHKTRRRALKFQRRYNR